MTPMVLSGSSMFGHPGVLQRRLNCLKRVAEGVRRDEDAAAFACGLAKRYFAPVQIAVHGGQGKADHSRKFLGREESPLTSGPDTCASAFHTLLRSNPLQQRP